MVRGSFVPLTLSRNFRYNQNFQTPNNPHPLFPYTSSKHVIPFAFLFIPVLFGLLRDVTRNLPLILFFEQIDPIERAGWLQFQPGRDALEVVDV